MQEEDPPLPQEYLQNIDQIITLITQNIAKNTDSLQLLIIQALPQFQKLFPLKTNIQNQQQQLEQLKQNPNHEKYLQLIKSLKIHNLKKNQFLFHYKQTIRNVYIILQGQVAIWEQKDDSDLTKEIQLTQLQNLTKQKLKDSTNLSEQNYFTQQIQDLQTQLKSYKNKDQESLLKQQDEGKKYFILPNITNQKIKRTLKEKDTIGELNAVSNQPTQNAYQAIENTILLQIPSQLYTQLFDYQIEKLDFIQNTLRKYLPNSAPETIKRLSFDFQEDNFSINYQIYNNTQEQQQPKKLYIIKQGSVKISQKIHDQEYLQTQSPQRRKKKVDIIDLQEQNIFGYENTENLQAQVTSFPSALIYSIKLKQLIKIAQRFCDQKLLQDLNTLQNKKNTIFQQQYNQQHTFNIQQQLQYQKQSQNENETQNLQQQMQNDLNVIQKRKIQLQQSRKKYHSYDTPQQKYLQQQNQYQQDNQNQNLLHQQTMLQTLIKDMNNTNISNQQKNISPEKQQQINKLKVKNSLRQSRSVLTTNNNITDPPQKKQQNKDQFTIIKQQLLRKESQVYESFTDQKSQLYDKLFQDNSNQLLVMEQNQLEKIKSQITQQPYQKKNQQSNNQSNNSYLCKLANQYKKSFKKQHSKKYYINQSINYHQKQQQQQQQKIQKNNPLQNQNNTSKQDQSDSPILSQMQQNKSIQIQPISLNQTQDDYNNLNLPQKYNNKKSQEFKITLKKQEKQTENIHKKQPSSSSSSSQQQQYLKLQIPKENNSISTNELYLMTTKNSKDESPQRKIFKNLNTKKQQYNPKRTQSLSSIKKIPLSSQQQQKQQQNSLHSEDHLNNINYYYNLNTGSNKNHSLRHSKIIQIQKQQQQNSSSLLSSITNTRYPSLQNTDRKPSQLVQNNNHDNNSSSQQMLLSSQSKGKLLIGNKNQSPSKSQTQLFVKIKNHFRKNS